MVRNRNEADRQQERVHQDVSNHQIAFKREAERDSAQNDMVKKANGLINEIDSEQKLRTVIKVKDEELEKMLNKILKDLENCIVLEMCPREKLPKLKLTSDIEESAKRILDEYLLEDKNIR